MYDQLKLKIKVMTTEELKEQLQEDLISHLQGLISTEELDLVCNIVIYNVNRYRDENEVE